MKANCAASGKRNAQGSPPSTVRFQAPNGQALQPGQGRVTAWLRSKTEVCSCARRSGRGREEMTSQKGVVTAPGRRPGTSVLGGGAQRGRGVGALMDPLHRSGDSGDGGVGGAPLSAHPLSALHTGPDGCGARLPRACLPTQKGRRQTNPLTEGWGARAPRGETSRPEGQSVLSARAGLTVRPEGPGGNRQGPGRTCVCIPELRGLGGRQTQHPPAWGLRSCA